MSLLHSLTIYQHRNHLSWEGDGFVWPQQTLLSPPPCIYILLTSSMKSIFSEISSLIRYETTTTKMWTMQFCSITIQLTLAIILNVWCTAYKVILSELLASSLPTIKAHIHAPTWSVFFFLPILSPLPPGLDAILSMLLLGLFIVLQWGCLPCWMHCYEITI